MSETITREAIDAAYDAEVDEEEDPLEAVELSEAEVKESILVRKLGTRDLGWVSRIYNKALREVRKKAKAGDLEAEGYETDDKGNVLGIGYLQMVDIAWDVLEADLNKWTSDLTGLTPKECEEDLTVLMAVIDEMEERGFFDPLGKLLNRLQGRRSAPAQPTS